MSVNFHSKTWLVCDIRASSFDKRACSADAKYARTLANQRTRYVGHIHGEPWKFHSRRVSSKLRALARVSNRSSLCLLALTFGFMHLHGHLYLFGESFESQMPALFVTNGRWEQVVSMKRQSKILILYPTKLAFKIELVSRKAYVTLKKELELVLFMSV